MRKTIETFQIFTFFILAVNCVLLAGYLWTLRHSDTFWGIRKSSSLNNTRRIALTFDDGPNPPFTARVADVLAKHQVHATFFFLGRNIQMHQVEAKRVIEGGHEIGNHGYSHRPLQWATLSEIRREIELTDNWIHRMGFQSHIPFRAPYGETGGLLGVYLTFIQRPNILFPEHYELTDYLGMSATHIEETLWNRTKSGEILMLHDGEGLRAEGIEALDRLLNRWQSAGYRVGTVGELLKSENTESQAHPL